MTTARGTICLFNGFRQQQWQPGTAMTELSHRLDTWSEEQPNASVKVIFANWNDNTDNIAAQIVGHRSRCKSEKHPVMIASYSWGQSAAVSLAKRLNRYRISVDLWCAIDPVYRSRMILLRWLAFTSGRKIPVPRNVKHIESWIQTNRAPRGAHLIAHEDTYDFGEHDLSKVKGMDHGTIQNQMMIHDRIIGQFTELASGRMLR